MRNEMKEIVIDLHQPLEDLMSDYHEYVGTLEDLEKEDLYEAVCSEGFKAVEDYLIHMNVI
jgi:hypothetical protein